jgi:hypothetical protein
VYDASITLVVEVKIGYNTCVILVWRKVMGRKRAGIAKPYLFVYFCLRLAEGDLEEAKKFVREYTDAEGEVEEEEALALLPGIVERISSDPKWAAAMEQMYQMLKGAKGELRLGNKVVNL